jgi:hypothetical protein
MLLVLGCLTSQAAAQVPRAAAGDLGFKDAAAFLQSHCVRCHGEAKQAGKFRLDDLGPDMGKDIDRWLLVRDQVKDGIMPPAKEKQPASNTAAKFIAWVNGQAASRAPRLPNQGNLIPHELLFGAAAAHAAPSPPRLWRLSPDGYFGFVRDVARRTMPGIVQPFTLTSDRGIKDLAGLYSIDEPSTEILLRNSEIIVESLTAHEISDGKLKGKNDSVREFVALMDPDAQPTTKQLRDAVDRIFQLALGRTPDDAEANRFVGLYEKCAKIGSRPGAVKTMLQAALLRTDAMYRSERGESAGAESRRMLNPRELAIAVSLTLSDRRDSALMNAAAKGQLSTREQVAEHVRRLVQDSKNEKPAALRFLREYFEYPKAIDIFKEKPKTFMHAPQALVADTDRLILHILERDQDVLRELLTTDLSFVNFTINKNNRGEGPKPAVVANPINNKGQKAPESVYGLEVWTREQPVKLPKDQRIGILMQPSWLVAHATNFDNDPVRRGRWVRERLLGGAVPDLPIGVVAQVPDDKQRTFRDRLKVTRAAECWKCHRHMDDLGLPFEQFDHYGRFRSAEEVLDLEATAKNTDKKGKPLGPVFGEAPLDTTGRIAGSGEAKLDGDVADPRQMVLKLADSERVRQVFVRHAFRFYLGRNETLSDAKTLQDADRAFVASGGSFRALVVSLLTSDAFLFRSSPDAALQGDSK